MKANIEQSFIPLSFFCKTDVGLRGSGVKKIIQDLEQYALKANFDL
jgi:hypothetical protein